jgi:hypothetical protein
MVFRSRGRDALVIRPLVCRCFRLVNISREVFSKKLQCWRFIRVKVLADEIGKTGSPSILNTAVNSSSPSRSLNEPAECEGGSILSLFSEGRKRPILSRSNEGSQFAQMSRRTRFLHSRNRAIATSVPSRWRETARVDVVNVGRWARTAKRASSY